MKETMRKFGAWLLAAALAFAGAGAARAEEATVTVNGTPCETLKAAFEAAKNIAGEITIAISAGTVDTANMDGIGNLANMKATIKGAGMDATELLWLWPKQSGNGGGIGCAGAELTFEDLALTINHNGHGLPYVQGLEHPKSQLYKNVKINGSITTMDDATFEGCLFTGMLKDAGGNDVDVEAGKYSIWVYGGGINFVGCTFKKTKNASVKLYGERSNGIACSISGTTFESAGSKGSAIYASNENNIDKPIYEIYIDAETKVEDGTTLILPSGNGLSVINPAKDKDGKITSGTFITKNTDSNAVKDAIGKAVAEGVEIPDLVNGQVVIEGGDEPSTRTIAVTTTAEAQAALDAAKEGDTIVLAAGTYDKLFLRQTKENSTREPSLDNGGSYPAYYREFKGITIKAADGAAVTVKGITAEAGLFWHSSASASNQADMNATAGFHSYLDIENLAIEGITFDMSANSAVLLRDNVISGHEGLYVDGFRIDNCSTVNGDETKTGIHFLTAGAGTTDNAFFTTEKKGINNVTVSNCTISNVFQPISFNNSTALLNNLTVTGNTFTDCGYSNILMLSNKSNTGTFTITGNTVNRIVARFIRSTNASADWTITGNKLVNPLQYEEESGTDVVKITGVPTTATITSTDNSWGEGSLVNGTWIANGDKADLVAVAEILDGKVHHVYPTLQAAFDAAENGETVVLLADVTSAMNEAFTVAKDKSITFDLNGKVLSGGNDKATGFAYLTNNGTLTLKDSSAEGTGKITSKTYPDTGNCAGFHTVLNKGTFVMESGTIEEASVKVGGGNNLKWAFRNEASANQTVLATIKGGTIVANYNAVSDYVYDDTAECTLNIEGGVIKSTGRFSAVTLQDAGSSKPKFHINVSGGEFIVENKINTNAGGNAIFYCDAQGNANADFTGCFNITGGKFNTFNTPMIAEFTADAGIPTPDTKFMTAGLSKCVIPQESIADGYACVQNLDEATKVAYPWAVAEKPFVPADGGEVTIDITPIGEEAAQSVPVMVSEAAVEQMVEKGVVVKAGETPTAAEVSEGLAKKQANNQTVWQNYVMGVDGTNEKNVLATIGEKRADKSEEVVVVKTPIQDFNPPQNTGVTVTYNLLRKRPGETKFSVFQKGLPKPEFDVNTIGLGLGDTLFKFEAVFSAAKHK